MYNQEDDGYFEQIFFKNRKLFFDKLSYGRLISSSSIVIGAKISLKKLRRAFQNKHPVARFFFQTVKFDFLGVRRNATHVTSMGGIVVDGREDTHQVNNDIPKILREGSDISMTGKTV